MSDPAKAWITMGDGLSLPLDIAGHLRAAGNPGAGASHHIEQVIGHIKTQALAVSLGTQILNFCFLETAKDPHLDYMSLIERLIMEYDADPFVYFQKINGFPVKTPEQIWGLIAKKETTGAQVRLPDGSTVLHVMACTYATFMVERALQNPVIAKAGWINAQRNDGATPLITVMIDMQAERVPLSSRWETLSMLLAHGADPGIKDARGWNAIDYIRHIEEHQAVHFSHSNPSKDMVMDRMRKFAAEEQAQELTANTGEPFQKRTLSRL